MDFFNIFKRFQRYFGNGIREIKSNEIAYGLKVILGRIWYCFMFDYLGVFKMRTSYRKI